MFIKIVFTRAVGEDIFRRQHMPEVVTIPDGVIVLDEEAFSKGNDIVKVICPDSLLVIGGFAFALCKELEEVVLPESLCGALYKTFSESPALRRAGH